jgi:CheY-like chemotaxis protein
MAGERVLIVEDNEKNMKLFRDVLSAKGYRTLEATSGAQAIELALEHAPISSSWTSDSDVDGVEALGRLDRMSGRRPFRWSRSPLRPCAATVSGSWLRVRRLRAQARGHRRARRDGEEHCEGGAP